MNGRVTRAGLFSLAGANRPARMNRRLFLSRLGVGTVSAAAAVCAFDVERLLWVPGVRRIFLPAVPREMWIPMMDPNGRVRTISIRFVQHWDVRRDYEFRLPA
jgi:hypothetical protein